MTQLIIAGVETALPQNFSVTVKRENPFFTKSGEYTYDCTLRLDNPVNQQLYGFLHRLNKIGQIATSRTAILIADGHVYCRGTEVITKWTDQTVSIQIVSGESELNWLIGQERKISELQLPVCDYSWVTYVNQLEDADSQGQHDLNWPTYNCCFPTIRDEGAGITYNHYCQNSQLERVGYDEDDYVSNGMPFLDSRFTELRPQPFLCALLHGIIDSLEYELGTDELATHDTFKRAFIVNTVDANSLDETLPGWTVKDFLTEVEKLTGCIFLISPSTNPLKKGRVDILLKSTFFMEARQLPLNEVVDTYETEVQEDASDTDQTTANLTWSLPDTQAARLACLSKNLYNSARIVNCNGIEAVRTTLQSATAKSRTIANDTTTGYDWIRDIHTFTANETELSVDEIRCVNYLKSLERSQAPGTMEMEIVPALMDWWWYNRAISWDTEYVNIAPVPIKTIIISGSSTTESNEENEDASFSDIIRESKDPSEPSKVQLFVALFNGLQEQDNGILLPVPYVDDYQAQIEPGFTGRIHGTIADAGFLGSLLLEKLDTSAYSANGAYQIDTAHAVTFQTFNPNHIDVRQVYVIQNRRYVVRDVEETITAEGRQPMWKLTCYPITISDEAVDNGWVLTRGVWDDGGAWLDTGRWNDGAE